jgi:phosphatidylglycerol:prolipoprotein diacylglycerol transferase
MLPYYQFTVYHVGPLTLQVWGTFVALGIAVSLYLGYKEIQERQLSLDHFLSMALWAIAMALVVARLLYVVLFWRDFSGDMLQVFALWNGGMVAYGGVAGALAAFFVYCRLRHVDFLQYLDVIALVFPLGYAIGRIGCHLIRDHMGKLTHVPWGYIVAPGEVRHDTAVYSILAGTVIFFIFWPNRYRFKTKGVATLWVVLAYGVTRFVIDIFRATDLPGSDPRFFGLTISQFISGAAVLLSIFLLFRLRGVQKKQQNDQKTS